MRAEGYALGFCLFVNLRRDELSYVFVMCVWKGSNVKWWKGIAHVRTMKIRRLMRTLLRLIVRRIDQHQRSLEAPPVFDLTSCKFEYRAKSNDGPRRCVDPCLRGG